MKIAKSHLKELIKYSIKEFVSEQKTVKFKDPETGEDHEVTMDTAQRYKSDIDAGDKSKEKVAAVKAAGLDKDTPDDTKEPSKTTKISADPFGDKEREPEPKKKFSKSFSQLGKDIGIKPPDWKHDEQAWADQWDKVQADVEEWEDNIEDTRSEYEMNPDDEEAKQYYKDDLRQLQKARAKYDAFKKVGDENEWTDDEPEGDVGGPAHPNVPKKEPSKPKVNHKKIDRTGSLDMFAKVDAEKYPGKSKDPRVNKVLFYANKILDSNAILGSHKSGEAAKKIKNIEMFNKKFSMWDKDFDYLGDIIKQYGDYGPGGQFYKESVKEGKLTEANLGAQLVPYGFNMTGQDGSILFFVNKKAKLDATYDQKSGNLIVGRQNGKR